MAPSPPASRSPSPTASTSGIVLPPNIPADFSLEPPNVLADRMLGLHSRPANKRGDSLLSVLSDAIAGRRSTKKKHGKSTGLAGEDQALLSDESDDDADEAEGTALASYRRSSRSRSHSHRRRLPWWKRPSPILFLPGTIFMSLSMGMTISPKVEIFYQLICRVLGPEQSGTTLPPPQSDVRAGPFLGGPSDRPDVSLPELMTEGEVVDRFVEQATTSSIGFRFEVQPQQGDSWSRQCHKSPAVQKAVTSLSTLLTMSMGILSALTTGWWGSVSDRRGRKPVLIISLMGMVLMDVVFLVAVNFHEVVGYNFLLVGPTLDGLMGGYATAAATANAYLADCTDSGSRARIFSVLGGLMFMGLALGPILGAWLISQTGNVLAPFYAALAMHLFYVSTVGVIFPESLSVSRQLAARERYAEDKRKRREQEKLEDVKANEEGSLAVARTKALRYASRPWGFLAPLKLMLPRKRHVDELEEDRPVLDTQGDVKSGWDFSLVKIAIALFCYGICIAVMQVKLLYTAYVFDWGYQENSMLLSYISISRVVVLLAVLPLFIKLLHKKAPLPSAPRPESADTAGDSSILTAEQKAWEKEAKWLRTVHDAHFDLFLARISIFIELIGYTLLALNGASVYRFLFATGFASFGGGVGPAMQSLALAHASPRDAGRLFASLSVLSSVANSIVGPLLFGAVFIRTVDKLPETIFWVAAGAFAMGGASLMTVRLRRRDGGGDVEGAVALVGGRVPSGEEGRGEASRRGRSSTRKAGTASAGNSEIVLG